MKHCIISLVALVLLSACNGKTNVAKYVNRQIGRTVVIDRSHYKSEDNRLLDSLFENSLFLIFTTPREHSCTTCFFSALQEIKILIDSCNTEKINCVVFTHENYDELLELKMTFDANHIFFINDYDDSYTIDNKLSKYTADYRTFLVNNNKKIMLVGNPIFNSKVRKLYEKEIKSVLSKES